ncbi:MAG: hypothetical protein VKL60_18070 [Sphaerospermopsis sp.]|nr:hypothetical protein [Sphaerospermopsis sp.]
MKFLYSTNEVIANAALAQINSNCGWPNQYTESWANVQKAYEQEIYFFRKPPSGGYMNSHESFTREEMLNGVVDMEESNGSPDWFPPDPDDI